MRVQIALVLVALAASACGSAEEPNAEGESGAPVVGGGGLATVTVVPGMYGAQQVSLGLDWWEVSISPVGQLVAGTRGAYGPGGVSDTGLGLGPFSPFGDSIAPYGWGMSMTAVSSNAVAAGFGFTMQGFKPLVYDVGRNSVQYLPSPTDGNYVVSAWEGYYRSGYARDINTSGKIVGSVYNNWASPKFPVAVVWTPNGAGSYTASTSPTGFEESWAVAVNDAGNYVVNRWGGPGSYSYYGYIAYASGSYSYISVPVLASGDSFYATDINIRNDVTGYVQHYNTERAFVETSSPLAYYDIGGICSTQFQARCASSRANALNDRGLVVGYYGAAGATGDATRGFAFVPTPGTTTGRFYDLTAMIPPGSPVTTIISAHDVDSAGRIVAIGTGPSGRRVVVLSGFSLT